LTIGSSTCVVGVETESSMRNTTLLHYWDNTASRREKTVGDPNQDIVSDHAILHIISKFGTLITVDTPDDDYSIGNDEIGTKGMLCTTDGATAAKKATGFNLNVSSGSTFPITFTRSNTVEGAITLNGAPVYINDKASSASNYTLPRGTYIANYTGSAYNIDTVYAVTDARVASKLRTRTVGNRLNPIYLLGGVPYACAQSTGSGTEGLVYVSACNFGPTSGYVKYSNGLEIHWEIPSGDAGYKTWSTSWIGTPRVIFVTSKTEPGDKSRGSWGFIRAGYEKTQYFVDPSHALVDASKTAYVVGIGY